MKTDNELIAEFMGFGLLDETPVSKTKIFKLTDKNGDPIHPYYGPMRGEQMRFGSSWDWLMPVALKIKHLTFKDLKAQELPTFQQASARWRAVQNEISNLKIEAAHYCIVKWIQWYNAQQ